MSGREAVGSAYRERNSTADRALDILGMFSDEHLVLSGADVARGLGVAKSTAYRYLQSLVTNRFLEEAPGGGFRLGLRVMELARLARKTYGLSEIASPVLSELAESVHETALLTRRDRDFVVCVDRAESQAHRVRISYERGSVLPINAGASALVLLAWSSPDEARAVLESAPLRRFTPATLTDVDELLERLRRIRSDGHSVTRSELDPDVLGIAAPILDDAGQVIAGVSVVALASRVDAATEGRIVEAVRSAADDISKRMLALNG
jgi:DNA-binding IclR family transcriptional regulator